MFIKIIAFVLVFFALANFKYFKICDKTDLKLFIYYGNISVFNVFSTPCKVMSHLGVFFAPPSLFLSKIRVGLTDMEVKSCGGGALLLGMALFLRFIFGCAWALLRTGFPLVASRG